MVAPNYDVIVLGGGAAGLAAVLSAYEADLTSVLIEKSELLGGATVHSYGLLWAGRNHIARAAGIDDRREDVLAYMRYLGGGEIDDARLETYVDQAPIVLKQLDDWGIKLRLVKGVTDHYYGLAPGAVTVGRTLETELITGEEIGEWKDHILVPDDVPCYITAEEQVIWGGMNRFSEWDQELIAERKMRDVRGKGLGLIGHLVKAVTARGIPIRTGLYVNRLLSEKDRVSGVKLGDGSEIHANLGVVISTGGYNQNVPLARNLEGFPNLTPIGPSSLTGDGLTLGAELGGIIHRIQNGLFIMLGYTVAPDEPAKPPVHCHAGIVELFSPHTLVVNKAGKRFGDESFFQSLVPALRSFDTLKHELDNIPCYLIFDQQYLDHFSFANKPVGTPVPASVNRSNSLRELAEKLGIDVVAFDETIGRFNGFAALGIDEDFHRGESKWKLASSKGRDWRANPALGPVEKAPFYGIELWPSIGNSAGLRANIHGQVLHHRGHPITGLYATGVVAARDECGCGYQAGINLTSGMTFSYLAVQHMANSRAQEQI